MIELRKTRDFSPLDIEELFHSVGWELDTPLETLANAMGKSSTIISAWKDDKLVGVARSMDDGCWSANIDCVVVHADYQNQGIGTALLTELLKTLKDVLYISVSPNEKENNRFYEKFGFKVVDGSSLLQIEALK